MCPFLLVQEKCITVDKIQCPALILILTEAELIFFIVATIGLCFGFVLKTSADNTGMALLFLNGAYRVKAFSASHRACLQKEAMLDKGFQE